MITKLKSQLQRKRVGEFDELLKQAYSNIKEKKFENAVEVYNQLEKSFSGLPDYKKTRKLHEDILVLYKEISLYLRINEAYLLAENGELDKLKEELNNINSISNEIKNLPDAAALLEYTKKHYEFCLEVYTYKTNLTNFNKLCKEARESLDNNEVSNAIKLYSQVLILYNKLLKFEDYEKRFDMYYQVKDLFRTLATHKLIEKAYKKPKIDQDRIRIQEPKLLEQDRNGEFKPRNLPEKYVDSKDSFTEIKDILANGDYSKASEIYKKL